MSRVVQEQVVSRIEEALGDYQVNIDAFEGPLDLLLHLIKKEHLDIYDIPVAHILEQYLASLDRARELNIDLAGEYILMAAELAYIKSRMLLPESEEEVEEEDPRADLVARLLEYQKYKLAGEALWQRPVLYRDVFRREAFKINEESTEDSWVEMKPEALLTAFYEILKKAPKEQVHEITQPRTGIAERVLELVEILRDGQARSFEDLFQGERVRADIVTTFLAILEMAKRQLLRIAQEKSSQRIVVISKMNADSDMGEEFVHDMEKEYGA